MRGHSTQGRLPARAHWFTALALKVPLQEQQLIELWLEGPSKGVLMFATRLVDQA
jgi:hypothetical protein